MPDRHLKGIRGPSRLSRNSDRRAVFLDRDGVINALIYHRDAGIVDSPFSIDQFRILPRVPQAIRLLNELGLPVIVVSNQPGIAKGHFDRKLLHEFDKKLQAALQRAGAHVDGIYYCLHHPEAVVKRLRKRCQCRKPGIAMLTRAARDFKLRLADSYMVGDGLTDLEAGHRAGCRTVFVGRWKCEHCFLTHPARLHPTLIAKDLWEAAQLIRSDVGKPSVTAEPAQRDRAQALAGGAA
jgi:D-glycero-D-manno-heptose 1,7-bisphosphate phosphatase